MSKINDPAKERISLVILKELIEDGIIKNRHVKSLFDEDAISSFEHLEIKNLEFFKVEGFAN